MIDVPGRLVLLGHPVSHSISPLFQNAALRKYGIPLTYETMDVHPDALTAVFGELRALSAIGNVTIPHKEAVRALCTRVTPLAEKVGAV
ncbi:MAG: Shikimate dehydrogenase, partial [Gemmatimonadetes bacterium]|nr:Shikimate dehydrogenase [Gemmatimonadota bacterium]